MKLLDRVMGRMDRAQAQPPAVRGVHPGTQGWTMPITTGASGMTITGALAVAAVWASIQLFANEVAKIPIILYRKRAEDYRERATDHPLYRVLHTAPNPEMTPFELIQTAMVHLCSWGNAYLLIVWDARGQVVELWPLRPDWMDVQRATNGALLYIYRAPGEQERRYRAYQVMHLRWLSFDGVIGYSPVRVHAQTIRVGESAKTFAANMYDNGAWPGGVLKFDGPLTPEIRNSLQASWEQRHGSGANYGRTAIIDKGWEYTPISLPPQETRFIESQQWTVSEIARIYGIPPHLIGDMTHATFSNIEQQSLDFLQHTLQPKLKMWAQAIGRDLLLTSEQETYYAEFLTADAVSVDITARYAAYNVALQNGINSINEIRRLENLNPIEGGDVHLTPLNLAPLGSTPAPAATRAAPAGDVRSAHPAGCTCGAHGGTAAASPHQTRAEGDDDPYGDIRRERQALARSVMDVFEDAARRIVRREAADIRRAIDKHLRKRSTGDFVAWLDEFYAELGPALQDAFSPLMRTLARQATRSVARELDEDDLGLTDELVEFIAGYLANYATDYTESSKGQLKALINGAIAVGGGSDEIAAALETRVGEWETTRSQKESEMQAFEAMNALVIAAYGPHGRRRLLWLASGTSCTFCLSLDGTVAGIEDYFVQAGTQIDAGGELGVMRINRNKRHGPLHRGCDCVVCAAD